MCWLAVKLSLKTICLVDAHSGLPTPTVCLWLAYSCSYHIFSLCQLTTLTTSNSLCLLLPAQNLSQIFPTIDSLLASGLTPRSLWQFLLSISVLLLVCIPLLFLFIGSVLQIKLAIYVSFCVHVNIGYIVSYPIVLWHHQSNFQGQLLAAELLRLLLLVYGMDCQMTSSVLIHC